MLQPLMLMILTKLSLPTQLVPIPQKLTCGLDLKEKKLETNIPTPTRPLVSTHLSPEFQVRPQTIETLSTKDHLTKDQTDHLEKDKLL